jgi:hypothetical protein
MVRLYDAVTVARRMNARLITPSGSTPALLTVDDESGDGSMVLRVRGVRRTPEDLPTGAYLEFDDAELADLASVAGYFVEPPRARKRRLSRHTSALIGVVSMVCAGGSLFWAVAALLALDLVRALVAAGLGLFMAANAYAYLGDRERIFLGEFAHQRLNIRAALGRGPTKRKSDRSVGDRRDGPPES